jgi:AcrR family transcriptional regulator
MPSAVPIASKPRPRAKGRRRPRQERSQHTVDAILSATKTLVVRHGVDKLTTNGVARLAGVSIGSLYQYFPSKRALIAELRQRHQASGRQIFRTEAATLIGASVETALRRFVEKMIEVHREDPALHRALEIEGRGGGFGEVEYEVLRVIRLHMELHRAEIPLADLDRAAFVVGVTVQSITHGIVLEHPRSLDDPTLVDDVVRMLLAYLKCT